MTFTFKKATREKLRARIALVGVSGSGKTYSSLAIAEGLGQRVALIDTERASASKYVGRFQFDVLELESFSPETYIEAIRAAHGYDVLVIDSLSHAWMGKDGALEQVDKAAKRSQSGNTFMAWRDVTPLHNRLVEAILSFPGHLVATMRAKTEYVVETGKNGKQSPRKVGLAPIQRDGLEYEFDIVGDISLEHELIISKTRCEAFDGAIIPKPGVDFSNALLSWLNTGSVPARGRQQEDQPEQQRPATQPDRTAPAEPEKLPTITSQNYHNKQYAKVPWGSLPTSELAAYIAHYEQRLREDDEANPSDRVNQSHRRNAELSLKAAQKEYEARASVEDEFRSAPPDMDRPQAQAD